MLSVRSLTGEEAPLLDHYEIKINRALNEVSEMSFTTLRTERNAVGYDFITERAIIEEPETGELYRVLNYMSGQVGNTPYLSVNCVHVLGDLNDQYIDTSYTGSLALVQALDIVFDETPFTYIINGTFDSVAFDDEFGNKFALDLFLNEILQGYKAEFELLDNYVVVLKNKIGTDDSYVFKDGYNITKLQVTNDATGIKTYVKGYGKLKDKTDYLDHYIDYLTKTSNYTYDDVIGGYKTETIGSNYTFQFTGTGFNVKTRVHRLGGRWSFTLPDDDDKTISISTYREASGTKTFEVVRGLENKFRRVIATFTEKDSKNPNTKKDSVKAANYLLDGDIHGVYEPFVGDERYTAVAAYTSPNASVYGIIKSEPVQNDKITTVSGLNSYLPTVIKDEPDISYQMDYVEFVKGIEGTVPVDSIKVGNGGYMLSNNLEIYARITAKTEFPQSNKTPIITVGNKIKRASSTAARERKDFNDLFDKDGTIKSKFMDSVVQAATKAITNSLTQLEYPEGMGIVARDPNDPNLLVALTSAGLGVSDDGGKTFKSAITALTGVSTDLLGAGSIRTDLIQIIGEENLFYWDESALQAYDPNDPGKYVKISAGLIDIAKGAITIQRPDGYVSVNNGIISGDFAIQGGVPSYTDPEVEIVTKYFRTRSTVDRNIDYIVFKQDARYINIVVQLYSQIAGETARVEIYDKTGGIDGGRVVASYATSETDPDQAQVTITVDMGTPTGQRNGRYIRIRSSSVDSWAYCRIISMYKEG